MRSRGGRCGGASTSRCRPARPPAREVLDGVLVIFGGALLLTPGLHHRHLRARVPAAAHARGRAARARPPLRRPHDRLGDARAAGRLRAAARARRRAPDGRRGHGGRRRRRRAAAGLCVSEPVLTGGEGFTDAATFAFADPAAGFFGLARAGVASGPRACRAARSASCSRAASRSGSSPRAATPLGPGADWDELRLPGPRRADARAARSLARRARRARRRGLRARVRRRLAAGRARGGRRRGAPRRHGGPRAALPRHRHRGRAPDRLPRPARPLVGRRRLEPDRAHALARAPGSRTAAR